MAGLFGAVGLTAACGSSDGSTGDGGSDGGGGSAGGFPLELANCEATLTFDAPPERIVLAGVGAGDDAGRHRGAGAGGLASRGLPARSLRRGPRRTHRGDPDAQRRDRRLRSSADQPGDGHRAGARHRLRPAGRRHA
ncbi:hypothetical protein [Brachybacterium sp. GPGPB12]|uniref:hypothetical protein n=1 Tax=Brachybacterium sp. GPGPB12 TaxID=3023517 RepID=UPI0031342BB0